ncbi:MAG: BatD family protein [Pseudoflavonifractor sp.]|nr:BatD family protein [Alloprevotella sp.]MCM1116670.1 BatD family protein [Pseudoflavonifractor sp.]
MKRLITILWLFALIALPALAQTSFSVQAPQRVRSGQKFAVTFRLANGDDPSALRVPQIEGCELLFGPAQSTRQSYQVINGQATSSSSIDFTYTYRAGKPGTYTIGEASISSGGKTYRTRPASFTVVDDPNAGQQGAGGYGGSQGHPQVSIDDIDTQSSGRAVNANDVIVRIILARNNVYEQEPVECTIKLYTKYNISSFRPTIQPSFDGCLIEELDVRPALNEVERYNDQDYYTAVLKRCILFPQKSGKITINSGNYDMSVIQYEQVNMGFVTMRNPVERDIKVTSNSASLTVKPLPSPAPDGFNGAVGKFSIDSRLVGNSFRTNDPATLIYTISGSGNIKYLKEPTIDFPSEFEQYTPKAETDTRLSGANIAGTMTIEYTFVPTTTGNFTIGSDKFVYFDPATAKYVTLTTPSYPIHVVKGASTPVSDRDRKDIEAKNTDIRHIRLGVSGSIKELRPVALQWWYWAIYLLLILALIGATAAYGKHARAMADVTGRRNARASKTARKRLSAAKTLLDKGETAKYHEELLRALWGYLGDKLRLNPSQLTRTTVADTLTARYGERGTEMARLFTDVIDACELARYTPTEADAPRQLYERATEAINNLERTKA